MLVDVARRQSQHSPNGIAFGSHEAQPGPVEENVCGHERGALIAIDARMVARDTRSIQGRQFTQVWGAIDQCVQWSGGCRIKRASVAYADASAMLGQLLFMHGRDYARIEPNRCIRRSEHRPILLRQCVQRIAVGAHPLLCQFHLPPELGIVGRDLQAVGAAREEQLVVFADAALELARLAIQQDADAVAPFLRRELNHDPSAPGVYTFI